MWVFGYERRKGNKLKHKYTQLKGEAGQKQLQGR